MAQRLKLQQELQNVIGARADGKQNVYFQPPESVKLNYPCIVYNRSSGDTKFAANKSYIFTRKYDVTLITSDPDTPIVDKMIKNFKMITLSRSFSTNNLYHDAFTLYY